MDYSGISNGELLNLWLVSVEDCLMSPEVDDPPCKCDQDAEKEILRRMGGYDALG